MTNKFGALLALLLKLMDKVVFWRFATVRDQNKTIVATHNTVLLKNNFLRYFKTEKVPYNKVKWKNLTENLNIFSFKLKY